MFKRFSLALLLAFILPIAALAQTTTNSTTLSAAATETTDVVTVASASTLEVGQILYADQESMRITSISSTTIGVKRGQDGTKAAAHYSGVTVYTGAAANKAFTNTAPKAGSCTAGSDAFAYSPLIHVPTGDLYYCINGAVVLGGGPAQNLKLITYQVAVEGTLADKAFFIADRPYEVVAASWMHGTAESTAGTLRVQLTKDTGTDAAGAGTDLLTNTSNAGFDCKATANTVQTGTLTATVSALRLATGNRLSLDFTADSTELALPVITVTLKPL